MNLSNRAVLFLSSGFYSGNIPWAPGTFGSLVGLAIFFLLSLLPLSIELICILGIIFLAIWVAHRAESILNKKDPGCIVIDEIAGILVMFAGLPWEWESAVVGFILFRLLDILKPFPIRWVERRFQGGWGVVADDLAAGVMGNILLRLIFGWIY